MATVETLITRVEKRISMAAGLDVQVHAEDTLLEMLRHKYNTLFDANWWYDYLTLETFTLDGSTGLITGDVSAKIRRFVDIHSVFLGDNLRPLPLLQIGSNLTSFMGEALMPYTADATKMFKVYPIDRSDSVHVWYRTRLTDDDWEIAVADETNVNMDDELLILGTVYDYLMDDGSNLEAVTKYETQYNNRYQQLVNLSFQHGISKHDQARGIPSQWRLDG